MQKTEGTEIRVAEPALPAPRPPAQLARARAPGPDAEPSLGGLAATLLRYRWTVLGAVAVALAAAAAWLYVAPPIYDASALVQVEAHTKTVPGFADVSPLFDSESNAEAEMRILRARPVLEEVVDELHLDTEVRPATAPVIGAAVARRWTRPGLAPPPFDLPRLAPYAWGGERIAVERLEVADELLGRPLTLTTRGDGGFEVSTADRGVLLAGAVGQPAATPPWLPHVSLLVSDLRARPGTAFVLVRRSRDEVVERLQTELRVAEQGKATGVVELALSGEDPALVPAVLNAVARSYIRQNRERTSAEATQTLDYLQRQLPGLKASMDRAETALNAYRQANGPVDLSSETKALLDRTYDLDKRVSEQEVEAAELHQRYSEDFPAVRAAEERLRNLRAQRAAVDDRVRALPGLELETARLERTSRLATELYLNVQNRAEQLRIVNAGWIGSVRVLEPAVRPTQPVSPKAPPTLALALALGLAGGAALAGARRAMGSGVEDPEALETDTGLPVLGAIGRSRVQRRLDRRSRRGPVPPLSAAAPRDAAVEDLRNLRASVQHAMVRAANRVVAVTGPAPRVGKSFVSANLALLLAAAGRRVVLVDGDLRRGRLHRHFGGASAPGLTELLLGTATFEAAVRATDVPGLSFVPTGVVPPNPSELAASPRALEVLNELSARFDVVVVDTPPVLAVSDPAALGRHAGLNLLVVRAGDSVRDVDATLRRLDRNGVALAGAILNDVKPARGRYARYRAYAATEVAGS